VPPRPLQRLAVALGLALGTFIAWLLLHPLPWPARAFATLLLVPLPFLLVAQVRLVQHLPEDADRESLYFSSALSIWLLAALAMLAARFSDFDRADLRLVPLPLPTLLAVAGATTLAGIAIMALGKVVRARETELVRFLIPTTGSEKIAFAGLSFSAGIAEELVYRSFLIPALTVAFGSLAIAVVVSIVIFAAAHAYQGWIGTIRVALLGSLLTVPFLLTGSVYPSILAHVALDLMAGIALADWLMDTESR
jgi:membrane protease YdiL (CAAX protease family)